MRVNKFLQIYDYSAEYMQNPRRIVMHFKTADQEFE